MNIDITEPISRKRWLNALGAGDKDDYSLIARLDKAEKILFESAKPKAVYRVMNRKDVRVEGFSLQKHLEGCHKVAVMALTLGIGVDNAIRKMQISDMAEAVIMDSGASVLVDSLCDKFAEYIRNNVDEYVTSRFSPGYGDSPLRMQKSVISYVDGQRKIGLNVTSSNLMIPRKSVTALIGLSEHPVTGRLATCGECVLKDKCTLRKEGKFCGY